MKQQTARERAERALQHMPITPSAKGAVTTIVKAEIKLAIADALEEAAKWAASFVPAEYNQMARRERATVLATREDIAAAIRALKENE